MSEADAGWVTLVVRSTGRAQLEQALAAIDAQAYPRCEIVLVDALGRGHRPLRCELRRHPLRIVATGRPLLRPEAANAGLAHARGEWIGLLDEDDFLDPAHVSGLVAASSSCANGPVYSATRILAENDRLATIRAAPYGPMGLHFENFIFTPSALFPRALLDRGCRFDESLAVLEDWDFWLQVAQHCPFLLVAAPTANYRATTGTSGTGSGSGRGDGALERSWQRFQAKWGARTAEMWEPIRVRLLAATRLHDAGRLPEAMALLDEIQAASPDEPTSRHALARVHLARGATEAGIDAARRAAGLDPLGARSHPIPRCTRPTRASARSCATRGTSRARLRPSAGPSSWSRTGPKPGATCCSRCSAPTSARRTRSQRGIATSAAVSANGCDRCRRRRQRRSPDAG